MKNFSLDRTKIMNIVILVLAVVTGIVYARAEAKENAPLILAMLGITAIIENILLVKTIPYVEYLAFLCTLIGMAFFIKLAFDEIGDVLSKININGLSTSWIASAVLIVVTVIATAVSTIFVKEK